MIQVVGRYSTRNINNVLHRMLYWTTFCEGQFHHFYGGKRCKWGERNSFHFFFFFTGLWFQLEKHVVMKMFRSRFYQEINSMLTQALEWLKLSGQLEKVPREPCCVHSALCFSAVTVKQVTGRASALWPVQRLPVYKKLGLDRFYDADKINECWWYLVKLWNLGEEKARHLHSLASHTPWGHTLPKVLSSLLS